MQIKYLVESQMVECSTKSFIHTEFRSSFFCTYLQICFVRISPQSSLIRIHVYYSYRVRCNYFRLCFAIAVMV